jgi:carbonic anhydrase
MSHGKFGTVINCMDGRAQLPAINWMKAQFKLDYVDMITEPGADKVMAYGSFNQLEAMKAKALISVEKHGSRIIVIAGHDDCAGNPVTPEEHMKHLLKAVEKIAAWKLPVDKVIGVWMNKNWQVEVVTEKP